MAEVGAQVIPPYMIATKEVVKERAEPVWTRRKNLPNVTESYHTYMTNVSTTSICRCARDAFITILSCCRRF